MPWYWTDDMAKILLDGGRMPASAAEGAFQAPIAIRHSEETIEAAAAALLDEGEIPLAA